MRSWRPVRARAFTRSTSGCTNEAKCAFLTPDGEERHRNHEDKRDDPRGVNRVRAMRAPMTPVARDDVEVGDGDRDANDSEHDEQRQNAIVGGCGEYNPERDVANAGRTNVGLFAITLDR